jgi:hypothetical protein
MSYVSLLKNIPEILSQPTGIAAIASIGIHGAIALIVPLMPVDNSKPKETDSSKSVGILELGQADLNRLPQSPGTPQIAVTQQLPQLPQQQQLALQPPVPPPNLNGQTTVFPPPPSSNYTQPPLSPVPIIPNKYPVSSFPKGQFRQIPSRSFQLEDPGFKASTSTITPSVPNFDNKPVVPQVLPTPQVTEPQLQPGNISPEIRNARIPEPVPTPNIASADSSIPLQPTQPESNQTDTQSQNSETIIPQNSKNGELINQTKYYEELRKLLKRQYPDSEEKPVIRDTISVNKLGTEGTVLGFVVVDPDNKKLEIKYQGKLPSPILDVRTRQYFKAKSLKGDQKISLYPFSLRFQDSSKTAGTTPESEQTPPVTTQPSSKPTTDSQPIIIRPSNSTQLKPTPLTTAEPSRKPTASKVQPTPTPSETSKPSTTLKPLFPTTPSETTEPSPTTTTNSNQLSSSEEPDRQLIQKLREFKEQREKSQPKK